MIEDSKTFELKVGIFILAGLIILFIIIFSIGDIYFFRGGYHINVTFNFANGIADSAPVRVAGVQVGEVEAITLYYDENEGRSKVMLNVLINKGTRIEKDSVPMINTLGLLGEKYLEIFPGKSKTEFVSANDTLVGHDPISVEAMTEEMNKLVTSLTEVVDGVKEGRGTLGKLVKEEAMYDDMHRFFISLNEITDSLKQGKGTLGKFFYDDSIYNSLEEFVTDLKAHPWKLFSRPKEETSSAQPIIRKPGK